MALNFCNNNSLSAITTIPASISGGGLNLISTQTASSSSSLSFTTGIDSTYKEYVFKFYNIHPSATADSTGFEFNVSTDSGSNYNVTKTTTFFNAYHYEDGNAAVLQYASSADLAQGTGYQRLNNSAPNSDDSISGYLHIFDPSNTTFVKHFVGRFNGGFINSSIMATNNTHPAGYFNTTSAVDAIDFKFSSGNIDSGVIKLYGVS